MMISIASYIYFPVNIYTPPTYISFVSEFNEKQTLTEISNEILTDKKIKKGTKQYKKELQKRIEIQRAEYFEKVKNILDPSINAKNVWDECSGKNCTYLSLKQLLGLSEYARNNRDFVTEVCMWGLDEPEKYKLVSPEYRADIENNRCELVASNGYNELNNAFNLIKIICSFMLGYLFMVVVAIKHYKDKNKHIKDSNMPIIL